MKHEPRPPVDAPVETERRPQKTQTAYYIIETDNLISWLFVLIKLEYTCETKKLILHGLVTKLPDVF